jgi:hypothetical protein
MIHNWSHSLHMWNHVIHNWSDSLHMWNRVIHT